jgi:hypothetical protein
MVGASYSLLVYWTDFIFKRKEPLKVSVSYALSATRAEALAEQLIAENILKGWKPVDISSLHHHLIDSP